MSSEQPVEKQILVTGASRGLGRAVAERLAADGHAVVVHYGRSEAAAEAVVNTIRAAGGQARTLQCDVSDRAACKAVLAADIAAHGAYYGVVLNAGIHGDAPFPALTEADWDGVMRTNLDGFYNVLQPCVMPMIQRRKAGRIVCMTSVSGLVGNRGQTNYSASKAGIIGAAKSLALELAKRKITVNCVAPGIIESDMTAELPRDQLRTLIPMQRMGQPEEVAGLVSFLCSDDAAYITRQVISVNGGMI